MELSGRVNMRNQQVLGIVRLTDLALNESHGALSGSAFPCHTIRHQERHNEEIQKGRLGVTHECQWCGKI